MKSSLAVIVVLLVIFTSCKKDAGMPVAATVNTVPSSQQDSTSTTPDTSSVPASWNARFAGTYKGTWQSSTYSTPCPGCPNTSGPLVTKDTTIIIGLGPDSLSNTTDLGYDHIISFDISAYDSLLQVPYQVAPVHNGIFTYRNDSLIYYCKFGGPGAGVNQYLWAKKQ